MLTTALLPLAVALPAIGRRIAGGGLNEVFRPAGPRVMGDTPARLIFGLTCAAAAWLVGVALIPALCLIVAIWLGSTVGNFGAIALGRGGTSWLDDAPLLALHGLAGVALAAIDVGLAGLAWWWVIVSGVMIVPAYEIGWRLAGAHDADALRGLDSGPDVGELLWGATIGLGLWLACVA